ncbi:MAG: hypothetical protein COA43_00925 [Robiginitomaculum sp.]|nr:MAG: hypothetical protein COA43_00925 [Robiginitomaculum sp.]
MSNEKPFFMIENRGFGEFSEADDLLHPEQNARASGDSVTETQYFGFSVPEHNIHALCYLWHHPNLGTLTGGVWVWQGIKRGAVFAEMLDMRTFMNDSAIKDDLHHFTLENSYSVKILEPLKRFHMTYNDKARNNSFDLIQEAVSPIVMFADGNHFEQAMKVTGKLVLRGQEYDVDCYSVRDRSWGKPRPEDIMPVPPMSWVTTVFNDNFSINCNCTDQASGNPELAGSPFDVPEEKSLHGGWVYKDGQVSRVVKAKKSVVRDPESYIPLGVELDVVDELGREFHLSGKLISSCPWETWSNVNMNMSLMRWECDGHVTYGDCQEAMWGDYLNYMASLK